MTAGIDDLIDRGLVAPERRDELRRVAEKFAVAVTDDMAALIDPSDPADPIAAQFVPSAAELVAAPADRADPVGDERWSPLPGLVHRYPDRVLLKPILVCPLYCRFCFRREQVGKDRGLLPPAALDRAFLYIEQHPEIWEVIVTGGDPFLLSPRRLAAIVRRLEAIAHVAVIRFHTRVPVAEPGRVGAALVAALRAAKAVWVVIHANHPRELTPAMRAAVPGSPAPVSRCSRRACCCAASTTTRRCSKPCFAVSSRCASSPITCIIPTWRRAPAISGLASKRGSASSAGCAAGCRGCASQATSSTFRAAGARCRSRRAPPRRAPGRDAGRSPIPPGEPTAIRPRATPPKTERGRGAT